MAVNDSSRSMNAELYEGRTDGILRKPDPNRGGAINPETRESRELLFPELSGYPTRQPPRYNFGEQRIPR